MAENVLAGDCLAHCVTFRDFMAGNFAARDLLTRIRFICIFIVNPQFASSYIN